MHDLALTLAVNPGDVLPTANGREHWRRRAELTKRWRTYAYARARNELVAGRWTPLERAHITITIDWPDQRRRDPANWSPTAKAIVDGLVDAGLLPDDDHRHVTGPDMRRGHGPRAVHVHIRPLHDTQTPAAGALGEESPAAGQPQEVA